MTHPVGQPSERIVKRQTRVTAQSEDDFDAVGFEHFHSGFGSAQCVVCFSHIALIECASLTQRITGRTRLTTVSLLIGGIFMIKFMEMRLRRDTTRVGRSQCYQHPFCGELSTRRYLEALTEGFRLRNCRKCEILRVRSE